MITIALAKGRLVTTAITLLDEIGLSGAAALKTTRKLVVPSDDSRVRFLLVKAQDVPTYVEYGVADMGIVGKDSILEEGKNVYEMLNLEFGACKMAVAAPKGVTTDVYNINGLRVATKYPRIAGHFFNVKKHKTIELIKLNGSVELAPIMGLSDVIVDIVESGGTLLENGLEILEIIAPLSARLIVNRVSIKTKSDVIMEIVENIRKVIS